MAKRGPSYGNLGRVKDPAAVDTLRTLLDRASSTEDAVEALQATALQFSEGQPISARNTRLRLLRDPQYGQDAVNLQTLIRYVQNQLALAAQAAGGDGELSNENGPIGAGSAPPTVPLPNLFADVQTYAGAHPAEQANTCIPTGGSWAYMTGLVAYLQGIDPRVGGNGKRGDTSDPSIDAIAYYHGVLPPVSGSNDVFVVDVITCTCAQPADPCFATGPGPDWNNVTTSRAAGAWLPSVP